MNNNDNDKNISPTSANGKLAGGSNPLYISSLDSSLCYSTCGMSKQHVALRGIYSFKGVNMFKLF